MMALSIGSIGFGQPLLLVALIVLIFGALEGERIWTRSRRGHGLQPGAIAYLFDALAIIALLLALVSVVTLVVNGLTSTAAVVGGVIDGERIGLVIVGMALALGLALVLGRAATGRRANRGVARTNAIVTLPISPVSAAGETRLAIATEQPLAYAQPQYERFEVQPPLAMLQERWQPGAVSAVSVPTSFLNLLEPPAKKPERSRFALASTLLVLALMVMVVSSALLFRHQLMNILSGMDASYGDGLVVGNSAPPSQPSAEDAAANVSAAAGSAGNASTAASPPAPATAGDAQAAQKRVKSNGLNLRAQPGTDQSVVAVLKQGDIVTVFNDARLIQGATWVRVRAGDNEGWVDQRLLE